MKKYWVSLVAVMTAIAAAVGLVVLMLPSATKTEKVVYRYVDAVNRGDLRDMKALLSSESLLDDAFGDTASGNESEALASSGLDIPTALRNADGDYTLSSVRLIGCTASDVTEELLGNDSTGVADWMLSSYASNYVQALVEVSYTDADGQVFAEYFEHTFYLSEGKSGLKIRYIA